MNVHGCGIGWYARERCGLVDELGLDAYNRPTVYTTVAAPSHDRNLRALSKTISSSLLFGHVRAAGPGASVHQYNCHPFFMGRYMFMHNGDITDFSKVRRGLQQELRDDLFDHMSGTTDSELLFLLILNRLPDCHTQQDPATLQQAVLDAFCAVIKANRGKANSLNIAFTDGETTIATRYRNSDLEEPPSLYYHVGPMPGEKAWDLNNADLGSFDAMESDPNVHDHSGAARTREDTHNAQYSRYGSGSRHRDNSRGEKFVATQALLVSSEPLTGGKGLDRWELLPSNSMIVAAPTRPTVGRCTRAALVAKLKEISAGGGRRHNLSESSAPVLEIEVKCIRSLCRDALGDECPEAARGVAPPPTAEASSRREKIAPAASPRDSSGGAGSGSFAAASLPSKGFLHGPSMGGAFRSNSGSGLSSARRQSVDVSRMGPVSRNDVSKKAETNGARVSALSETLGASARLGDERAESLHEADAPVVSTATATLGFETRTLDGRSISRLGGEIDEIDADWRVSARAEAAALSEKAREKVRVGVDFAKQNGAPRRNSSFTEGSSWDGGGWTSYNPATGPR